MKELSIKRTLNEKTRKQGLLIHGEVYSMHILNDEVIITDNDDYNKIYAIYTIELFSEIAKEDMRG